MDNSQKNFSGNSCTFCTTDRRMTPRVFQRKGNRLDRDDRVGLTILGMFMFLTLVLSVVGIVCQTIIEIHKQPTTTHMEQK